ncbi:hypothetical protein Lal_00020270 [Lupinus albus]|nr:hypothetical protein Lal_00020270 [Lupinus albus]
MVSVFSDSKTFLNLFSNYTHFVDPPRVSIDFESTRCKIKEFHQAKVACYRIQCPWLNSLPFSLVRKQHIKS